MLPESALSTMKVMFATPCYMSAVSMHYVTSLFGLTFECARKNLDCMLHMHSESLITRSRNTIVTKFLEEQDCTHLFWIDSDIAFSPEAVFRLLCADRDVVAGIYPMKTDHWPVEGLPAGMTRNEYETRYAEYPFNPIGHGGEPIGRHVDHDGFIEVAEAPTGFMAIKRGVFTRMIARYPELEYTPDGPLTSPTDRLHWLFFDCMVDQDSRRYLSEDFAFCRRWRDLGGKVYADLYSDLRHLGQRLYGGDLARSLKARGRL